MTSAHPRFLPAALQWTRTGRLLVLFLAGTSIACLLAKFYHLGAMRTWVWLVLCPAMLILVALTARFVIVTMAARLVFGVVLGLCCKRLAVAGPSLSA